MQLGHISSDNKLINILDIELCKQLVKEAIERDEPSVILCPHYSINIAAKYTDHEQLQFDLDELADFLGHFIQVSQYDDLVINFTPDC